MTFGDQRGTSLLSGVDATLEYNLPRVRLPFGCKPTVTNFGRQSDEDEYFIHTEIRRPQKNSIAEPDNFHRAHFGI